MKLGRHCYLGTSSFCHWGLIWRFLATSVGFHYLTEIGYIDQEIDDWFHGRNEEFVRSLEANYERHLNIDEDDTETYFHLHDRKC